MFQKAWASWKEWVDGCDRTSIYPTHTEFNVNKHKRDLEVGHRIRTRFCKDLGGIGDQYVSYDARENPVDTLSTAAIDAAFNNYAEGDGRQIHLCKVSKIATIFSSKMDIVEYWFYRKNFGRRNISDEKKFSSTIFFDQAVFFFGFSTKKNPSL